MTGKHWPLWLAFILAALGIVIAEQALASPTCEAAVSLTYGNTSETRPKRAVESCRRVSKLSRALGVPESLGVAVATYESSLDRTRVSSSGAVGVMQIKVHYHCPPYLGIRLCKSHAELAESGVRYLARLLTRYDEQKALTCYHDGISACRRGKARSRYSDGVQSTHRAIMRRRQGER
jgi:hypothetical protein